MSSLRRCLIVSTTVVCALGGFAQAQEAVTPAIVLQPSLDSLLPSVRLGEPEDMRLLAVLSELEVLHGIRALGDRAYAAPGGKDVLIVPLSPPDSSELTLFFERGSGQYLFLRRDRTANGQTEARLWSTGEDEIVITQTGILFLSRRSAVTFRLSESLGPNTTPDWLTKLECYLKAAGFTRFTFSSFKAFFSKPNLCSMFNDVSLVETAISCVTSVLPPNPGDIFNCATGIATILACQADFSPNCGGGGGPSVTVGSVWTADGNRNTAKQFAAGAPMYYYGNIVSVSGADVAATLTWAITGPCDAGTLWSGPETVTDARPIWYLQATAPSCAGSFTYTLTAAAGGSTSSQSTLFQVVGGGNLTGTWSGTWSWSGPGPNGCTFSDGGTLTMSLSQTGSTFSGDGVGATGCQGRDNNTCALIEVDNASGGTASGTISGSAVNFTFNLPVAPTNTTLFMTATGTLSGNRLSGTLVRDTGGSGSFSLTRH